jgi:transposase-like protein
VNYKDGDLVYLKPEEILYDKDIYPRKQGFSQATIDEYAENFENLPPVLVNQRGVQLDGYHRINAGIKIGSDIIAAIVRVTKSKSEDKSIARRANAKHGLKLTKEDKMAIAQEEFGIVSDAELADELGVSPRTIYNWTKDLRDKRDAEDLEKITNMWLSCETHETIAEAVNMIRQTVSDKIRKIAENCKISQTGIFADYAQEGTTQLFFSTWDVSNVLISLPKSLRTSCTTSLSQ